MIIGYIVHKGKKYFCGMGNTCGTAEVAEWNAQEAARCQGVEYFNVKYTKKPEVEQYTPFTDLLT